MENKIELTVKEKRELAMEEWKNYLLSLQHGDGRAQAMEKYRLIRLALAGRELGSEFS